ncbi:MAG: hypothetical protein QM758_25315 [Armatimonas sp.]
MQQQIPSDSYDYSTAQEEIRIEGVAQGGMKYLRRWVLALICIAYTIAIVLITLIRGHVSPVFLGIVAFAVGFVALMLWVQTTLMAKYWPQKKRPVLVLRPEGLQVESPMIKPALLPWEAMGTIEGASALGLPIVRIRDPQKRLKALLGSSYWMYWWPGGIGLNALTFGYSGAALAEKIQQYRDEALS